MTYEAVFILAFALAAWDRWTIHRRMERQDAYVRELSRQVARLLDALDRTVLR